VSQAALTALLSLSVGACFAPSVTQGVPCDPDRPNCPSAQHCVRESGAFVCSTSDNDPPDAYDDDDDDTVLDVVDNCPLVANASQANYDGDRFGDACDPCPPFADDQPSDLDGDRVADACDPDPTIAGDRIVHFDALATLASWQLTGTWTAVPDGASVDLNSGANATLALAVPVSARTSVMASFTATAMRTLAGTAGISVTAGGMQCALIRTPTTDEHIALLDAADNVVAAGDFALDLGQTYVSTLTALGIDRYRCRADGAEVAGGTASPPVSVGIRARGVRGTVHWVLVIAAP
jgi:hypothetical protein